MQTSSDRTGDSSMERLQGSQHIYPNVNASGNARLHLDDMHYHNSPPTLQIKDSLHSSLHSQEIFARFDNIDDPHSDTFA